MAQAQGVTNFAYNLTAQLLNANAMYIAPDAGVMTDYASNTNKLDVELNVSGFGRQAGTRLIVTTTNASDTAQIYYLYTCNANQNINGHCIVNNTTNGNGNYNVISWCRYNATQVLQANDTLNAITNFQIVTGA